MTQYISKDALVAEIEKRKHRNLLNEGAFEEDIDILSLINTFEVKDVDLEKEINCYFKGWGDNEVGCFAMMQDGTSVGVDDCVDIAKHFFELGLRAQNMITPLQQQRISVMKMEFGTGLQTFNESEKALSDAYNKGIEDVLEELELKAQKGE